MPNEIELRPARRSGRKRAFCSGVAYSANVRIGPKLPAWMTSADRGQAAATCSIAMTASISVPPCPPSASGMVMPSNPCSAAIWATSKGKCGSCARAKAPGASLASAHRRTESANSLWSAVKLKSTISTSPGVTHSNAGSTRPATA
jgi:hypothetical protein